MNARKKPWQVAPSNFIAHAMEHANRKTDFDKQMAFLVLDIGVETTLKTFLDQYEHKEYRKILKDAAKEGRDVNFYTIVTEVKRLTTEKIPDFDPDEIMGFHEQRNDLYHDKTRLNPPDEDLQRYIEIAKMLLKVLLDVDVSNKEEVISENHLLEWIQRYVTVLQLRSSLVVEHLYPKIATRRFAGQLKNIKWKYPDTDFGDLDDLRDEWCWGRIEAFNELTGWELSMDDYGFVEQVIDEPEQLHVWIALQELSNDWQADWKKYNSALSCLKRAQNSVSNVEDEKSAEISEWAIEKVLAISGWLQKHMPDVEPPGDPMIVA